LIHKTKTMKLKYKFFGKEDFEGRTVVYEYDAPFHKNMDEDLKSIYGENLSFVKEINHARKIIRLHSAYDSGKGTRYVAPLPRKKPRKPFPKLIKEIYDNQTTNLLKLESVYEGDDIIIIFTTNYLQVFTQASIHNGQVGGFKTNLENNFKSLFNYLKRKNYYPIKFEYIDINNYNSKK
jgi:hypothetical protein